VVQRFLDPPRSQAARDRLDPLHGSCPDIFASRQMSERGDILDGEARSVFAWAQVLRKNNLANVLVFTGWLQMQSFLDTKLRDVQIFAHPRAGLGGALIGRGSVARDRVHKRELYA
jgi:hypothetical protein